MKRLIIFLLVCTLSVFSAKAQTAPVSQPAPAKSVMTLEECLNYAVANNISVRQADLTRRMSKNTLLQSKLNLLPTITANASYNFNFGNSIDPTTYTYIQQNSQSFSPNIQANVPLFMGLQQINNIKKDKYDLMAYMFDYSTTINNTLLNVTNLFLQIVLNRELVKSAEKQVSISQSQLDITKSRIRAGTMAEASVYDFQAQLARDQATVTSQKNTELLSVLMLKIALQLPDDQPFDITVPELSIGSVMTFEKLNPHDIYQYALSTQPSVQAADARVKSAEFSTKMAKGTMSPTISLSAFTHDNYFNQATTPTNITYSLGDITTSRPIFSDLSQSPTIVGYDRLQIKYTNAPVSFSDQFKNNLANGFSFNMSIPIFTGWQKMTNVANAKLQQQIQQLNAENVKNNLKKDVYQSYINAVGNAQTYSANLKALEAQQKAFEVVQKKYNAGIAVSYELEQSRDNLTRSEANAIQAKYNYIFSVKVLDFYQGKQITLN